MPQQEIIKELSRHDSGNEQAIIMEHSWDDQAAQLAIIKQLRKRTPSVKVERWNTSSDVEQIELPGVVIDWI